MKNKRDNYFVCVEKLENIFRPLLLYNYITEFDLLSNCNMPRVRQWKSSYLPFRGQFCRISISIICSFFLLCIFGLLFAYFVHSIFLKQSISHLLSFFVIVPLHNFFYFWLVSLCLYCCQMSLIMLSMLIFSSQIQIARSFIGYVVHK